MLVEATRDRHQSDGIQLLVIKPLKQRYLPQQGDFHGPVSVSGDRPRRYNASMRCWASRPKSLLAPAVRMILSYTLRACAGSASSS